MAHFGTAAVHCHLHHARQRAADARAQDGEAEPLGVVDNRRFFLIDAKLKLVSSKRIGELIAVHADYDMACGSLTLSFPDGSVLCESVAATDLVETKFNSVLRTPLAAPVCPRLSAALSEYAGMELTMVRADPALTASDRGPGGVVSLLSRGSNRPSRRTGQEEPVDPRRFRMLFEVDGLDPHAEDAFVGQQVPIGTALVEFAGHVGRCRVTSMDPDTGRVTLPTLDLLRYRRGLDPTEPLPFGIYGGVLEPGVVRIGDRVVVQERVPAGTGRGRMADLS